MRIILIVACLCLTQLAWSQHTFSIVAVDPVTGEIGSAGATCLTSADCGGCGGAVIISEIAPGKGAVNAQAQVCIPNVNADYVLGQINTGASAEEALQGVLDNDQCQFGNTPDRQYGIVTFHDNVVNTDAFTGKGALSHAGHRIGEHYAIQGNILLGPEILDQMEAGFLATEGEALWVRLMGAMQGANVPGADSRCLVDGISSKSSFLRIARPDDEPSQLSVDIVVENTPTGIDPIDELQNRVNAVLSNTLDASFTSNITLYPNPAKNRVTIHSDYSEITQLTVSSITAGVVLSKPIGSKKIDLDLAAFPKGVYFVQARLQSGIQSIQKLVVQ